MIAQVSLTLCLSIQIGALPAALAAEPCDLLSKLDAFAKAQSAPADATCTTYLTTNGTTGTSCNWKFAYRSDEPQAFANELWTTIKGCRAGTQMYEEKQVNHPDSYGLRLWHADEGTYAVAVKDKANLEGTFVFLRLESSPPTD